MRRRRRGRRNGRRARLELSPLDILGISAFYHDSAAALVRDGKLVAAAQEERFSRKRHDAGFPAQAARAVLKAGGLENASKLDAVVFYEKPFRKFERLLKTYLAHAPAGLTSFLEAAPVWAKRKLWMKQVLAEELDFDGPIKFVEHHESHAASAFYPSPFESAAVLTMDGVGEWATASIARGSGRKLAMLAELRFPDSLGMLYSAFTYYAGFKVNSGEYKLMGLAPMGEPKYKDLILKELIDLKDDGSFRLNLRYFDYCVGTRMTNARFHALFGGPPREPETPFTQRDKDIAASAQAVCEEVMLRMARRAKELTGEKNLCLAGGVALNCVGNARVLRENIFENVWVQPAAGDAGGAVGAALLAHHEAFGKKRVPEPRDGQSGSLLGPDFPEEEIEHVLIARDARYRRLAAAAVAPETAKLLAAGKVVGWFQGRMEFGPRALGARSILADPRDPQMRSRLNLKIKKREGFRPFAPAVLAEKAKDWFELSVESPYMMLTAPVREEKRAAIPAVTHVDGSARVQTVAREEQPLFHALISAFDALTRCPLLVNTSFNQRGEPIVCRPEEGLDCFLRTDMDALVLGPFLLLKEDQPAAALAAAAKEFAPD